MAGLFGLVFYVASILLIVGLIKPSWLHQSSRKRVALVFGGIAFVSIVIAALALPSKERADITTATSTTEKAVSEAPAALATTEASTTTTTEKPKAWVKVFAFSGNSKKRSDTFILTGAKARINYSTKGMCSIHIVGEGDSLEKSGGFPEVQANNAASCSSMLVKDAGSYYLDVKSGSAFSVVIEEWK